MRTLTDRALDTATAQGAGYADVRIVRRIEESIAIKTGRIGGRRVRGGRGLRDPGPGRRRVGVRQQPRADRGRGGPGRGRGGAHRPGERHGIAPASRTGQPAPGDRALRDTARGRPIRDPARAQDRGPDGRRRRGRTGQGHRLHRIRLFAPSANGRPSPPRTARSPSRPSPTSGRPSRPMPSTATSTSAGHIPIRAAAGRPAATSTSAGSTSPDMPARWPTRRSSC